MGPVEEVAGVLCMTVEEFERDERRQRRERGRELARKGLAPAQIAERLGVEPRLARRWVEDERGRAR